MSNWHTFTTEEAEYTGRVLKELESVPWAKPLLSRVSAGGGLCESNMPLLFEARIAAELVRKNLTAEYEYKAGVGDSTIDFKIHGAQNWLVEIMSIGESNAFKNASWSTPPFFGVALNSPASHIDETEKKQSTEGEMLLAGQKIGEKVFKNNAPTKFPDIQGNGSFHIILVDMRRYQIDGGDFDDYAQIALGPNWVSRPEFVLYWQNPKTNITSPIRGLFEKENPLKAAQYLQQRIHMIGFIRERDYSAGEISKQCRFMVNSRFIDTEEKAMAANFFE